MYKLKGFKLFFFLLLCILKDNGYLIIVNFKKKLKI